MFFAFATRDMYRQAGAKREGDDDLLPRNRGGSVAVVRPRLSSQLWSKRRWKAKKLEEWKTIGFLNAGNETTTNLSGNVLNIVAERLELWRQPRDDRSFVDKVGSSREGLVVNLGRAQGLICFFRSKFFSLPQDACLLRRRSPNAKVNCQLKYVIMAVR